MQAAKLPIEAKHTAKFVENFDELFNAFNSRCLKSKKKHGHAFSEKSGHKKFLNQTRIN